MRNISKQIIKKVILTTTFLINMQAYADISPSTSISSHDFIPPPPTINAKSYILIDAKSGVVLVEKNADLHLPPASLTKVMSLYIITHAIQNGTIHWDDKVRISNKAWKAEGSRMFVQVNDSVSIRELVQGIITASGNDATIAMAEYLGGTEDTFAQLMNNQAKQLGMENSNFTDSTGLPNDAHYSTARDLAKLAQAYMLNFPEYYPLFAEKWFTYNNIKQANRNRLLWRYPYADGLKTGHTSLAGFCLIGTAKKDDMRLISVIMGAPSDEIRTESSIQLFNYGFRFYHSHKIYDSQEPVINTKVWQGDKNQVSLGLNHPLYLTIPNSVQFKNIRKQLIIPTKLIAPIYQGQEYGTLNIILQNKIFSSVPLIALSDVKRGSWWSRTIDGFIALFTKNDTNPQEIIDNG